MVYLVGNMLITILVHTETNISFMLISKVTTVSKVRETIYILGLGAPGSRPSTIGEETPVLKVQTIFPMIFFDQAFTNRHLFLSGDQPCVLHHLDLWVWPRRHWKVDFRWTQVNS